MLRPPESVVSTNAFSPTWATRLNVDVAGALAAAAGLRTAGPLPPPQPARASSATAARNGVRIIMLGNGRRRRMRRTSGTPCGWDGFGGGLGARGRAGRGRLV